jgi:hypothetical protein
VGILPRSLKCDQRQARLVTSVASSPSSSPSVVADIATSWIRDRKFDAVGHILIELGPCEFATGKFKPQSIGSCKASLLLGCFFNCSPTSKS